MTIKIKHKRGTASNITSANPTLAAGELAFETDTRRFKVGDGTTAWSSLSYVTPYVTATDRILGRSSAGAGSAEEITCTAAGRALLSGADAAAQRTTLSVQPTASPAFTGAATVTNDGNVVPLTVTNTGTANSFVVNDASGDTSPFVIDADGNVGIGGAASSFVKVHVLGTMPGNPNVQGFRMTGEVPSTTTGSAVGYVSFPTTQAASFTVSQLLHFSAAQGTFGAGSSVTNQFGFIAQSSLTGATNNYGFYSDIASGTGRWNFYANGTAASYFGGQVQISAGSASACGVAFSGDANTGMFSPSADVLAWATNGSERFRVASNGDAQVGGVNVVGLRYFDVRNTDSTLNSGAIMRLITRNAANTTDTSVDLLRYNSGLFAIVNNDNGPIALNTGGYERVRVDASGNVGIGIGPSTLLHLNSLGVLRLQTGSVTMDCTPTAGATDSFVWNTSANAAYRWSMNGNERMRIESDGKLYAYNTYGTVVGATNRDLFIDSGGLIGYVSSIRASKTNIAAIDDVSWLRHLTPVSFHYRKRNEDGTYSDEPDGTLDYGLIAEDVEPVAPEMCFYDVVDGEPQLRGVHYSKLITPMLRYIQQLEQRIAALEERINA